MAGTTGIIPEKIINYKLYVEGAPSPSAIVDVDLPDIKFISESIEGAGTAGQIDSQTLGHVEAMNLGLNIRTFLSDDFKMLLQKVYTIELKAATQSLDQSNGKHVIGKLSILAKGTPTGFSLGKLAVGKSTDSKREFSLSYLKIEYDGEKLLEIDKINMICEINGQDMLSEVRAALGM